MKSRCFIGAVLLIFLGLISYGCGPKPIAQESILDTPENHYNQGLRELRLGQLDKASEENERNAVEVETEDGRRFCFVQIAGLIARRIICRLREGDTVVKGRRFGLICFGSRLDVYLPTDFKTAVVIGDVVKAGTSVLGELNSGK